MSVCKYCKTRNQPGAKFCRMCRTALPRTTSRPRAQVRRVSPWLSVGAVMHHRTRQWAVWGGLAAFLGSFMPWTQSTSLLGMASGLAGSGSPEPMIVALGALLAVALAFYRRGENALLVIGAILTLAVVTFALGAASSHPSWGLLVTLAGTAMIAYSGYSMRHARR